RLTIREAAVRIGPALRLVVSRGFQQARIPVEDLRGLTDVRRVEARAVAGHRVRALGVESAEAEEAPGMPVDGDAFALDGDVPLGHVPVRHVEARVTHQRDV